MTFLLLKNGLPVARLVPAGKTIGYYDLIVAATAIERNCEVATFNQRHFGMVPDLRTIELA